MLQRIFNSYEALDEIDLEENALKMVGPYDPGEFLSWIVEQL